MEGLFKGKAKSIAVAVDGSEPSWEAFSPRREYGEITQPRT